MYFFYYLSNPYDPSLYEQRELHQYFCFSWKLVKIVSGFWETRSFQSFRFRAFTLLLIHTLIYQKQNFRYSQLLGINHLYHKRVKCQILCHHLYHKRVNFINKHSPISITYIIKVTFTLDKTKELCGRVVRAIFLNHENQLKVCSNEFSNSVAWL